MPTIASTSRVQLRYMPEVTYGVTPVTGNCSNLRMISESLDFALTKTEDKEIRQDRQMSSATTTNALASGDVKGHMQYAEYDRLFAGLMQNAWTAYGTNGVGATFTATFTATTITATAAPTGTSAFTNLQPGQWFSVLAAGALNNLVFLRNSTTVAVTTTVITLDPSTPAQVEGPIATTAITSSRATNGTTKMSFSIERNATDIGQFMLYTGMNVSKFAIGFATAALTEATFSFMGKKALRTTVTGLPGTPVASQTYNIQNGVTGVGTIWEAGVPITTSFIKAMTLDIDNTLRAQDAIGALGAVAIGVGTLKIKGNLDIYFADGTQYDKFLGDVYTSLTVSSKDALGNGYIFTIPKVQLMTGKIVAGGKDADLMASFTWQALADLGNANPLLTQTIFIDRVGQAVLP